MATDGSQQGPQRELVPTGEDSTHRAPSPAGPAWHTRGSGSIEWTPQEDMRLLDLVARYGRKWQKIQEHFNIGHSRGNYAECNATNMPSSGAREPRLRTSIELYRRFEKLYSDRIYHKGRWTKDEDRRLLDLIKEHGTQWVTISRILGTRSERQCRQRWIYTLRIRQLYEQSPQRQKGGGSVSAARSSLPQLRRGRWTKEEDEQLRRIVKELGGYPVPSWVLVSQRLGTRTDSQCCYRWHQYHSESARYRGTHPWSLEDDRIIWDHCRAIDKLRDSKRLDSEVNYDWSKLSHQLSIPQPTQAIRSRKYMLYRAAKRVAEARIDVDSTEGFEMVHR
ncbi:Myb- protein B, partial [Spiromyces aspiralis]